MIIKKYKKNVINEYDKHKKIKNIIFLDIFASCVQPFYIHIYTRRVCVHMTYEMHLRCILVITSEPTDFYSV